MTGSISALRAARVSLGWSQARAAEEIAALAVARGVAVAAPVSLKTQLSRWENQHALPEEHYRALLCSLYDSSETDLGFTGEARSGESPESPSESLRDALSRAASLDEEAIALLSTQLDTVRQLDRRLGPAAAENSARSILSVVDDGWRHCVTRTHRRALALLVADSALLCAEHAVDRMRVDEAWRYWETAKGAAHDAEAPELAGFARLKQAGTLVAVGEHRSAIELITETDSEPNLPRPWVLAVRGYAHATLGEAAASHEAFAGVERSLGTAVRIDIADACVPLLGYGPADMDRDRGHAQVLLGENSQAVTSLERALGDASRPARDLANLHVDLAYALTGLGHADAAASHAGQARAIAGRSGCLNIAARLDERFPTDTGPPGAGLGVRC